MVGFDSGDEVINVLDGRSVSVINANLTADLDFTAALKLTANRALAFQGPVRVGDFDIGFGEGLEMLCSPNPSGQPNSNVLRPTLNGGDITQHNRHRWVVDFGSLSLEEACGYEGPFRVVELHVKAFRSRSRDRSRRERWWLHGRTGEEIRRAVNQLDSYVALCQTAKHILWRRYPTVFSPEQTVIVVARDDYYFFGLLSSQHQQAWAKVQGTQLRERESGFRCMPTTCFETFPFPFPTPDRQSAIAAAARELDDLRNRWLNPPEWTREEVLEFPGSLTGPWARYVHDPDERGIGIVRYPRIVPRDDAAAEKLKERTLTNLYNQRPTWLDLAHRKLDEAVFAAYGWDPGISDEEILERLLALNLERAAAEGAGPEIEAEEQKEG